MALVQRLSDVGFQDHCIAELRQYFLEVLLSGLPVATSEMVPLLLG